MTEKKYTDLVQHLNKHINKNILEIFHTIKNQGYKAFLVGGFLRDIIIGRKETVDDIDIATSALPDAIISMFSRVIPTGIKHGTVTVHHGIKAEITTFRSESGYEDFRHPENIDFHDSIDEDLSRRDFTINAMAYDPIEHVFIDPYNGYDDIRRRVIQTVKNPDARFNEDALRILRAVRFSNILMFEIEEKTLKSIKKNCNLLKSISCERIRDEFNKLVMSDKPSFGLELLRITGILTIILPELESGYGIYQNEFHLHDIYHHNLFTVDAAPKKLTLRLAALFHDIGKTESINEYKHKEQTINVFYNHELFSQETALKFMTHYRYSAKEINIVTTLIKYHMFHYTREWSGGAIRRFVNKVGEELIDDLFALRVADRIGNGKNIGYPEILLEFWTKIQQVIDENHAIKIKDIAINGNDLMKHFRLPPSKLIGDILNYLLDLVIDDQALNKKSILLEKAKDFLDGSKKKEKGYFRV